jgi:hypothetical protein
MIESEWSAPPDAPNLRKTLDIDFDEPVVPTHPL